MITATFSSVPVTATGTSTFTITPPPPEEVILTPTIVEVDTTEPLSCFKAEFEPNPCFEVRYDENPCFTINNNPNYEFDYITATYDYGMTSVGDGQANLEDYGVDRIYGVWHDVDDGVFHETYASVQIRLSPTLVHWRLVKFRYHPAFGQMTDYEILDYADHEAMNMTGNKEDLISQVQYSSLTIKVAERWPLYAFVENISDYTYGELGAWDDKYLLPSNPKTYQVGTVNGTQHCGDGFTGQAILMQRALKTVGGTVDEIEDDIYANSSWGTGIIHKQGDWFVFSSGAVVKNPTVGYFSIADRCYYGWRNAEMSFSVGSDHYGNFQFSDEIMMCRRIDFAGTNFPYSHPIDFYDLTTGLLITSIDAVDATLVGGRHVMYGQYQGDGILRVVSVDTL